MPIDDLTKQKVEAALQDALMSVEFLEAIAKSFKLIHEIVNRWIDELAQDENVALNLEGLGNLLGSSCAEYEGVLNDLRIRLERIESVIAHGDLSR